MVNSLVGGGWIVLIVATSLVFMAAELEQQPCQLQNVAPEITQVNVLAPGVALQEIPQQPVDPAIISAGLDPATFGLPTNVQPRKIF